MTTTGANTFGALLDGEPFLPGGGTNPLDCVYQFVNGGYFFALQGNKRNENNSRVLIGLATNSLEINENTTYALSGMFSETNEVNTGELTITRLDLNEQIVSGTFFFDIIDQNGELRQIRDGRFDMQYTQ